MSQLQLLIQNLGNGSFITYKDSVIDKMGIENEILTDNLQ